MSLLRGSTTKKDYATFPRQPMANNEKKNKGQGIIRIVIILLLVGGCLFYYNQQEVQGQLRICTSSPEEDQTTCHLFQINQDPNALSSKSYHPLPPLSSPTPQKQLSLKSLLQNQRIQCSSSSPSPKPKTSTTTITIQSKTCTYSSSGRNPRKCQINNWKEGKEAVQQKSINMIFGEGWGSAGCGWLSEIEARRREEGKRGIERWVERGALGE